MNMLWFCECCISHFFTCFFIRFTDFVHVQMHFYHHLFIACESWLCGLQTGTLMETTISLMKNTNLWWLWNFKILRGSPIPDPPKKRSNILLLVQSVTLFQPVGFFIFLLKPLHKCLNNFSRYHSLPELKEKWSVLPSLAKSWKMQQNMVFYRLRVAILKTHHLATQKFSKYPPPPRPHNQMKV